MNFIKKYKKILWTILGLVIILILLFNCINILDQKIRYKIEIQMNESIHEAWKSKMDVPLVSQLPELNNGCEVTSLTMMLNYKGVDVDKITLANEMKKDNTKIIHSNSGDIKIWGNPQIGFVGDVTGKKEMGYAIDPYPLSELIEKYYPNGCIDLSGSYLSDIEKVLSSDRPIVVWITSKFKKDVEWIEWNDLSGNEIKATFSTHAVTLTGFDDIYMYYNDPLSNEKDKKINKKQFLIVWNMMGRKALTLK